METGSSQIRDMKRIRKETGGRDIVRAARRRTADEAGARGDVTMQSEASQGRFTGATARPLAELLACPPTVGNLLNASAKHFAFDSGDTVFRQMDACRGLYVVIAGQLQRKAERRDTRLTLGAVRAGELVELAAALGDQRHTYTLTAQTAGSVMLLPLETLRQAFQAYPPLRMQLLEELAREVSRAYGMCSATRMAGIRRRGTGLRPPEGLDL
jgi:Cyclic nucleotide-binding domain